MHIEAPKLLKKSVSFKGFNRPAKILFIVPQDECEATHAVLDAVFAFSYTRWAGCRYLILPASKEGFESINAIHWTKKNDADVVYSYVKLSKSFIHDVEKLNSPAHLIEHNYGNQDRTLYIPNLGGVINPLGAVSCVHSPRVHTTYMMHDQPKQLKLICKNSDIENERFFTDNFGNELKTNHCVNQIQGLFDVVRLLSKDTPEYVNRGDDRVCSISEVLDLITNKQAVPISRFSNMHFNAIGSIKSTTVSNGLNITIGETISDRINFWNLRHFFGEGEDSLCSFIIPKLMFKDDVFVESLIDYLDKANIPGSNGRNIYLRSTSESKETLEKLKDRLSKSQFANIKVPDNFDSCVYPTETQLKHQDSFLKDDHFSLKIYENHSTIVTPAPKHIRYIQPKFMNSHAVGDWCTEALIDRHNNLSVYSNVIDSWLLPKRQHLSALFGSSCIRISRFKLPTYLARHEDSFLFDRTTKEKAQIDISLPEDGLVCGLLVKGRFDVEDFDMRSVIPRSKVDCIRLSDKGKNLIGVIAMFQNLREASSFLTDKLWREVLETVNKAPNKIRDVLSSIGPEIEKAELLLENNTELEVETRDLLSTGIMNNLKIRDILGAVSQSSEKIYSWSDIESFCPDKNNKTYVDNIMKSWRLSNNKEAGQLIRCNFHDSLTQLVNYGVFYLVYSWTCYYCGHKNTKNTDNLNRSNTCEICQTNHDIPIGMDFKWSYAVNMFVFNSLYRNSSLMVLWALAEIQRNHSSNSFLYLPEVDIFYDYFDKTNKNEVDLLGIVDGNFFIGEAKRSAEYFLFDTSEKEKYLKLVDHLNPDIAILVFEILSECAEKEKSVLEELELWKKNFKKRFSDSIEHCIMIATEYPSFSEYGDSFAGGGEKVRAFLDEKEKKENKNR